LAEINLFIISFAAPAPEYWNKGSHGLFSGGTWRARGARAYNGCLGAEPSAGSRSRVSETLVRGAKPPPEAESFLALGRATDKSKFVLFAVFSAIHYNKIERYKIRAGTPQ